jgi:hypothetical protein
MILIEKIDLPNSLTVHVWDHSRRIAADTTQVALEFVVPVKVRGEFFDSSEDYELIKKVFGPEITFMYRKERTFVKNSERESVFWELLDDFKRDSLPYLGRPNFAARFVLSKLADIKKRPHKYRIKLKG